ncbi:hypothetical protein GYMLUDRAFT_49643 [Collybiopsis luxurians FD-317 M1]|uniref:Uncharacterized protein n=1 Tax=Collybiopsis luxurians FD-317 M1 TaxID=944289 RepID=A0A0D0C5A1_9AGAR|nr:hypothetical protein GYMLUDRAFT_49643 [Collybiopsis luxurians FD-317 M1]
MTGHLTSERPKYGLCINGYSRRPSSLSSFPPLFHLRWLFHPEGPSLLNRSTYVEISIYTYTHSVPNMRFFIIISALLFSSTIAAPVILPPDTIAPRPHPGPVDGREEALEVRQCVIGTCSKPNDRAEAI